MKNKVILITIIGAALAAASCTSIADRFSNDPYEEDPFWARYLDTSAPLDLRISNLLDRLQAGEDTAAVHNELGALLVQKGFPKDAETEFKRALRAEDRYYPAWYNLALARQARGDEGGARRALRRTLSVKPGHAAAHFQLGLMYEKSHRIDDALEQYAHAFRINEALLDPAVNPRILDTKLVDLALLRIYPEEHLTRSLEFEQAPYYPEMQENLGYEIEAPSDVAEPEEIVTPAPPPTDRQ